MEVVPHTGGDCLKEKAVLGAGKVTDLVVHVFVQIQLLVCELAPVSTSLNLRFLAQRLQRQDSNTLRMV